MRIFCLCLTLILFACSQNPNKVEPVSAEDVALNKYQQQIEQIKSDAAHADYTALRKAYSLTALYQPWDSSEHEAGLAILNTLAEDNYGFCLQLSQALLQKNYTSLMGHFGAWNCNKLQGDFDQANFHRQVIQGLMQSISASGDGKQPGSAWLVYSETEMRDYIRLKSLLMFNQEAFIENGRHLRRAWCTDPKNAEAVIELYFDLSPALFTKLAPPEFPAPSFQ
ncbi:DUF4919 domain-containing protein [Agaribacterium haliotis]|uniref:DUF4919 domain-containing protein n=1 Tax=Agaribacterium haliotis TaxID=2013869 RepID=UPI000BB58EFB|nr:DUF4919 domain-containing protein [Agaribacterium haliotis]